MPFSMAVRGWFICPQCDRGRLVWSDAAGRATCAVGGLRVFYDLEPARFESTDAHYTLQRGRDKAFFDFIQKQPKAKAVTPGGQMARPDLFNEVRTRHGP